MPIASGSVSWFCLFISAYLSPGGLGIPGIAAIPKNSHGGASDEGLLIGRRNNNGKTEFSGVSGAFSVVITKRKKYL
jgi:hypothetical protein